jgi:hypothetical protein
MMAGWTMDQKVQASKDVTFASNPTNGQTIRCGAQTYTFATTLAAPYQVKIGVATANTLDGLIAALNQAAGAGTTYSAGTVYNPIVTATRSSTTLTILYRFAGPFGNGHPAELSRLSMGGYKLLGSSPQTRSSNPSQQLAVKLHVYDTSGVVGITNLPVANAKFMLPDESASGIQHQVKTTRTFRCIANRCQFFCYATDTNGDPFGSVLAGGVPHYSLNSACSGDIPVLPADSMWWSMGDANGDDGHPATTPRTVVTVASGGNHYTNVDPNNAQIAQVFTDSLGNRDASDWVQSDALKNTVLNDGTGGTPTDRAHNTKLTSLHSLYNYTVDSGATLIDSVRWHGGGGLAGRRQFLEPLLQWGNGVDAMPRIRSQVYDAWIGTDQVPAETVQFFPDGHFYVAFTHQGKFGTLWLRVPAASPVVLVGAGYAF